MHAYKRVFYRTTALTLHCGSRFITTSMAFLDFLKPLKWKGLKLSHGLNSRNFFTVHIVSIHGLFFRKLVHNISREIWYAKVRIHTYLLAVSIATTWAVKLKDIIIQMMGPNRGLTQNHSHSLKTVTYPPQFISTTRMVVGQFAVIGPHSFKDRPAAMPHSITYLLSYMGVFGLSFVPW